MSEFPLPRIADFLRQVSPFDILDERWLNQAIAAMEIAYFPRGQVVIAMGGEPAKWLSIIYSGSVKITLPENGGGEMLVDIRGEGDVFGAVSLLNGARALFDVTAQEDLIVFCLPATPFRRLVDELPAFRNHFNFSLARDIRSARSTGDRYFSRISGAGSLGLDEFLMASHVSELMTTEVLACPPATPIRAAAMRMTEKRVGSMIVTGEAEQPLGILTDTDIRARVVSTGLSTSSPVAEVMSRPLRSIHPKAFAFEALIEMTRHGVHHLAVTEAERLVGIISDHDLKAPSGLSSIGVVRDIDMVDTVEELALLPAIRKAPADALIVADGFSCRTQVFDATGRMPLHCAELLATAFEKESPDEQRPSHRKDKAAPWREEAPQPAESGAE